MTAAVGFVGAGQMGGPMVERLIAAGLKVHLFARRAQVRERFAGLGAVVEESVPAVARSAGTLIVCPFNEEQLQQIAGGPDGLIASAAAGTVVVQHATVSVAAVSGLAAAGAARGVELLDAPVSGTAKAILAGQLTVLVGGEPAARDRAEPALRAYCSNIIPTGGVGTATKVKLVNNLLFAAHVQTAGEALRLGESLGIKPGDLLAALAKCSGNSFALDVMRQRGDPGQFAEGVAHFMRKDVAVVERLAGELGLATGLLGAIVRDGPFALTEPPGRSTERT
jgi:3-hydroxyisobutyrate dehydrogenase-like beta-hydroxyacid dehydrogenase